MPDLSDLSDLSGLSGLSGQTGIARLTPVGRLSHVSGITPRGQPCRSSACLTSVERCTVPQGLRHKGKLVV